MVALTHFLLRATEVLWPSPIRRAVVECSKIYRQVQVQVQVRIEGPILTVCLQMLQQLGNRKLKTFLYSQRGQWYFGFKAKRTQFKSNKFNFRRGTVTLRVSCTDKQSWLVRTALQSASFRSHFGLKAPRCKKPNYCLTTQRVTSGRLHHFCLE